MLKLLLLCASLFLFTACQESGDITVYNPVLLPSPGGDVNFTPPPPVKQSLAPYPWQKSADSITPITKYHLRCKGDWQHSLQQVERGGEKVFLTDCAGIDGHSLPLRNGSEFVYPIMLKLLNYIQKKSGSIVVVTSGHRCPEHHAYIDPRGDPYSKHQIGAAVDFYVEGYQERPEVIIAMIQTYYREDPHTSDKEEFTVFQRYQKETDVKTLPWFNKEVFVKLYKANEGRNGDNDHGYPYIQIQVRWDRDCKEKVTYSWAKAYENYYRK